MSDDPRRFLRRRLHADLSRADVPRRGLPGGSPRDTGWSVERAASSARWPARRRFSISRRASCMRRRDFRPLHPPHPRADGRPRDTASTPAPAEIYDEWAACQHFELYDDVAPALRELERAGLRIGLISTSHRCLASFQSHFELDGPDQPAAVSSSEHGLMKPHPSIFARGAAARERSPCRGRSWWATACVRMWTARWLPACARFSCTAVPRRTRSQASLPRGGFGPSRLRDGAGCRGDVVRVRAPRSYPGGQAMLRPPSRCR